jgi:MFS family permease
VLIIAFVFHGLRAVHPLIDLKLFQNRQLTFAVLTMTVFAIGFFGAGLLFPSYFLQVHGESTLMAGLLLAPQGLGAMLTMPIAGQLVDRIGPGKIVLVGLVLIIAGMSVFTQVGVDTGYPLLLGALFVMGMGMGCTMMPTMTAALQTLTDHSIARGSTLMNIVQQASGSIGTATMSVILTSRIIAPEGAPEGTTGQPDAEMLAQLPPEVQQSVLGSLADAFGDTFTVAMLVMVLALIPAAFLPRRKSVQPIEPGTVPMH